MFPVMLFKRPDESTAFPKAIPPIAKITTDQSIEFQSSFVKIPVPKKARIGKIAITPISPTKDSMLLSMHHKKMVSKVMNMIKF